MRKLLLNVVIFGLNVVILGLVGCSEGDGNWGTDADAGVTPGDASVQPRTDITGDDQGGDTALDWPELLVEMSNDFMRNESPNATDEEALSLASANTGFAVVTCPDLSSFA